MQSSYLKYNSIPFFSNSDQNYINQANFLQDLIQFKPNYQGLLKAINKRKEFPVNRSLLVEVLKGQYAKIDGENDRINELLDENTFTVTTAHQPCLATGPLYVVLKALTAINLAEELNKKQSNKILPVFIIGTEDHDYEEINHFSLFGNKITWKSPTSGAVGDFSTENLDKVIAEAKTILGKSKNAQEIIELLQKAYAKPTYAQATQQLLHDLFGKYGLIVLDMNDERFKKEFAPVFKKELETQFVEKTVLKSLENFPEEQKIQVQPRNINVFYSDKDIRSRIVLENGIYKVIDTNISWNSIDEIPLEKLSGNVMIRPMFQEFTLPNIAYVGGGGEVNYWMELKSTFTDANVFFPTIIRRNSALFLDKNIQKKLEKFDLSLADLCYKDENDLIKNWMNQQENENLDLSNEIQFITDKINEIKSKATQINKGLEFKVEADKTKITKILDELEKNILKAEKKNQEQSINQILNLYNKIFPQKGLQERKENIFQYINQHGFMFIDKLKEQLSDVLESNLTVLEL